MPEAGDKTNRFVAVDGATGYLGTHLIARLKQQGFAVRAIVHTQAQTQDVEILRSLGADVRAVDLTDHNGLKSALEGVQSIVHLIGSIAPKKGETLDQLHAGQAAGLIAAAREINAGKIIMVTALGTGAEAASIYHRTKWQAEEALRQSGVPFVILRPSLIVGKTVGRRNSKLVDRYLKLIATRPTVPLVNGGKNKLQPVFVNDLADALIRAVEEDRFNSRTVEIGGSEIVTMNEFVQKLIKVRGQSKKTVALPEPIARLVATVCEAVQSVPLLSNDQVTLSKQDNICLDNGLNSFGITATSLDQALATYQENDRETPLSKSAAGQLK